MQGICMAPLTDMHTWADLPGDGLPCWRRSGLCQASVGSSDGFWALWITGLALG